MEEIGFILSLLEDECERGKDPKVKNAYQRSKIRFDTLKKISAEKPISRNELKLLLEFGNVSKNELFLTYPHISDANLKPEI
ncbi:MAG: hypothetical protein LCH30_02295 [Proteobacteria bacterium]|nr:hypothetical protein [Pseudomonadota bacterium]